MRKLVEVAPGIFSVPQLKPDEGVRVNFGTTDGKIESAEVVSLGIDLAKPDSDRMVYGRCINGTFRIIDEPECDCVPGHRMGLISSICKDCGLTEQEVCEYGLEGVPSCRCAGGTTPTTRATWTR